MQHSVCKENTAVTQSDKWQNWNLVQDCLCDLIFFFFFLHSLVFIAKHHPKDADTDAQSWQQQHPNLRPLVQVRQVVLRDPVVKTEMSAATTVTVAHAMQLKYYFNYGLICRLFNLNRLVYVYVYAMTPINVARGLTCTCRKEVSWWTATGSCRGRRRRPNRRSWWPKWLNSEETAEVGRRWVHIIMCSNTFLCHPSSLDACFHCFYTITSFQQLFNLFKGGNVISAIKLFIVAAILYAHQSLNLLRCDAGQQGNDLWGISDYTGCLSPFV